MEINAVFCENDTKYGKKQTFLMLKQMTYTPVCLKGSMCWAKCWIQYEFVTIVTFLQTNLIYPDNCLFYIILDGFTTCDLQGLQCLAKHAGKNRIYCWHDCF